MYILHFLTPKANTSFLEYDSTIRQALEKFDYHKYSVVPLIDEEGRYISTLSEGDLLRFIKNDNNFDISVAENKSIKEIKPYRPYKAISINSDIEEVIKLSLSQNFIPIIDDRGTYIGIIKRKDIIEYMMQNMNKVKEE
ncbi:MAG: CBS domain-containing protein [Bacilli bacterium]